MIKMILIILPLLCSTIAFGKDAIVEKLQNISVTVSTHGGTGSGVIITRDDTSYILTAAHVIDDLRKTRKVISPDGSTKTLVTFNTAKIIKPIIENNEKVGKIEFFADVIRYSDGEHGEDLALLRVKKKNLTDESVEFYLKENVPGIGADLYHVGSLLGESGANSLTSGILSQHGRIVTKRVYDQTTCAAFPGSSGGGVFLKTGDNKGEYIGMIVRGSGETFNLIVPVRRIKVWADRVGVSFILDPSIEVPEKIDTVIEDVEGAASVLGISRYNYEKGEYNFFKRFINKFTDE